MAIAIISIPEIPAEELAWIDDLRRSHPSPAEADLPPHVTLVFPANLELNEDLTMHMYGATGSTPPVTATFRIAAAMADPIGGGWAVQLLPDDGMSKLMRLRDFLYTGPVADHLNLDIPYVPNITVARTSTGEQARSIAAELNANLVDVTALFTTVELIRVEDDTVTREATHMLEG